MEVLHCHHSYVNNQNNLPGKFYEMSKVHETMQFSLFNIAGTVSFLFYRMIHLLIINMNILVWGVKHHYGIAIVSLQQWHAGLINVSKVIFNYGWVSIPRSAAQTGNITHYTTSYNTTRYTTAISISSRRALCTFGKSSIICWILLK